ncbi:MAG: helix-turn-helix transcriptional regulator [Clostridia bacterium]|nr:helix-turn-helix transcriptional regulator [Clostridia bacterium]
MPDENFLYDVAELFKIFGDSTRIRILTALQQSELNVCDLASVLNMTKSAVSHQLRILRQAKLVKNRRVGKEIFYSLDDEHVRDIIAIAMTHLHHAK